MSKPFVHPQGLCESTTVGDGTRVWAFAHVLPGASIGADCNICDHVFIENQVVIGDRVTIKCGVQIWDGITLGEDVFVGPNVTFTNDKFPRSKQYQETLPRTLVERGASIGANSTILPGITIGSRAMVGAGSVVTRSVPPRAKVVGNPARIVGYVDAPRRLPRAFAGSRFIASNRFVICAAICPSAISRRMFRSCRVATSSCTMCRARRFAANMPTNVAISS